MKKIKLRLPAVLLLVVSLLFWGLYDRYKIVGEPLFGSILMEQAQAVQGDCSEDEGHFVLNVGADGKVARVRFSAPLKKHWAQLRVRGRIKVDGVVKGKNPWDCARVILIQRDADNKWIQGEHGVLFAEGTHWWKRGATIFEVQENTQRVELRIEQAGKVGKAEFDRLVVEPVHLRVSYIWLRNLFAGLWILMGAVYFFRCRLHRRRLCLLIMLNALVIIVGVLMPEKWVKKTAEHLEEDAVKMVAAVESVKPKPSPPAVTPTGTKPSLATSPPKKKPPTLEQKAQEKVEEVSESVGGAHGVGHFCLFASLCFLVYWSAALERQHRSYYFKVALDIMLFAAITESLQFLTMDRTPGIKDWVTDFYGMLTAFLLFVVLKVCFFWKRRKVDSMS